MNKKLFLAFFFACFALICTGQSFAYTGIISKLDDLYDTAKTSPKFPRISKPAFETLLKTGKLARVPPLIKAWPKEDKLIVLLEIAELRNLVKPTQMLGLAGKYKPLEKGDELLMAVIEHGDSRLFPIAPKYGDKLLSVERSHKGAGIQVLDNLGDEGWQVVKKLPGPQIPKFAKHSKSISAVESADQRKILNAIVKYPKKTLQYLDEHPGILLKATGATAFLTFVHNLSQPGGAVSNYLSSFLGVALGAFIIWLTIKIWGTFRKQQIAISKTKNAPHD